MGCFYNNGLKFSCQGCNYCCSSEPGYVFLSQNDLTLLAQGMNMTEEAFINTYCRKVDMGAFYMVSLIEKENYDCIFLSEKGCKVYNFRPTQCRTYPFWANVLENETTWNEESKLCKGMNHGKLYTKKEIEDKLNKRLGNDPLIIVK